MRRAFSERALLAALVLALAGLPARALAEPRPVSQGLIGTREERVYFAPIDSSGLDEGWRLTFVYRGRSVASGVVARLFAGELAVGRITSGSLPSRTDPERLMILGEPPLVHARPLLRIGFPAPHRANLLFACGGTMAEWAGLPSSYRAERAGADSAQFVREAAAPADPPWPDTLIVRSYGETADEEIALERGDLDVAVFWPGELSPHVRDDPRWQGHLTGTRHRGVVACLRLGGGTRADSGAIHPALVSLNQEVFRGDLVAWSRAARWAAPGAVGPDARGAEAVRFSVDPACPGQWVLSRFLDRRSPPPAARDERPELQLFYVDAPVASPDAFVLAIADHVRRGAYPPAVRARADSVAARIRRGPAAGASPPAEKWAASLADSLRVRPLFAVGCPLVCAPGLRPYLVALGPDALVSLLACHGSEGER